MSYAYRLFHLSVIVVAAASVLLSGCRATQRASLLDVLDADELEKVAKPSNDRNWEPNLAVLPRAELRGNMLTVFNIRNTAYLSEHDYVVRHYDKTFDLNDLRTLDFIVVPFPQAPSLAHTMLSFGFEHQGYLAVSAEVRLEQGESYSPVKGAMRQYELMYLVADERDVIPLRTKYRNVDVYLYRTRATPEQARAILMEVMARVNKLNVQPEFYDTLTNNCTTNIVEPVNRVMPGKVPFSIGVVLPGHADRLAYDLGLLDTRTTFEKTRRNARITRLANRYLDAPDFSQKIRQR